MREIKFRAWSIDRKVMFDCWKISCGRVPIPNSFYNLDLDPLVNKENCILMQYTGLHDKNGNEIFEGDIVLYDHCSKVSNAKVIFQFGCFVAQVVENGEDCECHDLVNGPSRGYKVIGNVYEDSHLLNNLMADHRSDANE